MADRFNELRNESSPYLDMVRRDDQDDMPSVVELAVEHNIISKEEAETMNTKVTDEDVLPVALRALLQKLHQLGLIWWYGDSSDLAETVILSPQWVSWRILATTRVSLVVRLNPSDLSLPALKIIDHMAYACRDFRLHRLRRDDMGELGPHHDTTLVSLSPFIS